MPNKIAKSYAISDAKIVFVSLVDKAANKHEFLITKSEGNNAEFQTYGRIVKTDTEKHYVTGIVYEPMVEDTDGNYMTEEEITKAAHWFMKNAGDADIQHCFEKAEGVEVVESYVAKCDMEIEGQPIKKGTWLMTMEVSDAEVWDSIEKREITGFSMGGKGSYSEVDVDISDPDNPVEKAGGKKGILKALASMFGMDVEPVEKGAVKEKYKQRIVSDNFWTAYYSLSGYLLETYNPDTGYYEPIHDETKIREALEDFNSIVMDLLANEDGLLKSIEKSGKKMSAQNKETLTAIHESLGSFLSNFNDEEDNEVNKSEVKEIIAEVMKELKEESKTAENGGSSSTGEVTKGAGTGNGASGGNEATGTISNEAVREMIQSEIQKALHPEEEALTPENVQEFIEKAVKEAMEPLLKSTGVPTNLNDAGIEKGEGEQHYLHGII